MSHTQPRLTPQRQDIAIVGMACRLPGAEDYRSFWQNLRQGRRSIGTMRHCHDNSDGTNAAATIEGAWCFDHEFFGVDSFDADWMDPHHRLLLEESWHCIEDSGIALRTLQSANTAVFTGVTYPEHAQVLSSSTPTRGMPDVLGTSTFGAPNRISRLLKLSGKSVNIDSGCATGLVAIHDARNALSLVECDYALVATARIIINDHTWTAYSNGRLLSPEGRCRVFDRASNGFVLGEAVGVVLLQRLDDALANGSHVYGVIKGTAVNHTAGRGGAPTLPSPAVLEDVITSCYSDARVPPTMVDYVELHGVGTQIGDAVEAEAVSRVFGERDADHGPYHLGSVKGNIGYSENGSGISGLIKVLLMMDHDELVPTVDHEQWSLLAQVDSHRFHALNTTKPWPRAPQRPRRGAMTAAGAGGVCAHILIEEGPRPSSTPRQGPQLFGIAAPRVEDFGRISQMWTSAVGNECLRTYTLADICRTQLERAHKGSCRWMVLVDSLEELKRRLADPDLSPRGSSEPLGLQFTSNDWRGFDTMQRGLGWSSYGAGALRDAMTLVEGIDPTIAKQIRRSEWDPITSRCANVVGALCLAQCLEHWGVIPQWVSFSKAGVFPALVTSGMIDAGEAIELAIGLKPLSETKTSRPSLTLLDAVSGREIRSIQPNPDHLQSLLDHSALDAEQFGEVMQKSAYLHDTQFTYRRAILRWAQPLRSLDIELSRIFSDPGHAYHSLAQISPRRPILVVYILTSAMEAFTDRWGLRPLWSMDDSKLAELFGWLRGGLLPPAQLTTWLSGNTPLQRVAPHLSEQRIDARFVRNEHSEGLHELGDRDEWLGLAIQAKSRQLPDHGIEITKLAEHGLLWFLAECWQIGADVDWARVFEDVDFTKVPLPGYPFLRSVHRIEPVVRPTHDNNNKVDQDVRWSRERLAEMRDHELDALFLRLHG